MAKASANARRWLLALAAVATAALAATVALNRSPRGAAPSTAPAVASARDAAGLYALSLPDADGRPQSLSQWRGKWLLVNFWATWCAPCVAEMPELDKLGRELAARNFVVIGIGAESQPAVHRFRDRLGLRLPLLAGGFESLSLARDFGDDQGFLPYTAMLSPDGQLVQTQMGALEPGQVRKWVAAIP